MDKITLKIDEIKSIQKNPTFFLANYFNYLKRKVNSAFFENQKQFEITNRINLFEKDLNNKTEPFNSFNHEIQQIENQLTKIKDLNINKTLQSIDEIKYKIEKKLFSNKSCIFFKNQFLLIINDEFLRKNTIEFVNQITGNLKKENLLAYLLIEKLNQINFNNTSSNVLTIDIEASKQIKINLSFKQIKSIHYNTLTGLKSLQVLHLNDNQILELNNEIIFNGLINLKEINFSKNQIKRLHPNLFNGLISLKTINFRDNLIKELHSNLFNGLTNLNSVDFNRNQINYLHPNLFNGLNNLKTINFGDNLIRELDSNLFIGLANLKSINFELNQIDEIQPNTFNGLNELKEINFNSNQINNLHPSVLYGLTNLKEIRLIGNEIKEIHPYILNGLVSLKELWLTSGNQIEKNKYKNKFK
jgi:Leucine-rich repeat (LRR) protein